MSKFIHILYFLFICIFTISILGLTVRGIRGNPTTADLAKKTWTEDGPFELSPERGRFALTYSIINDRSLSFSVDLARFVIPDLGYKDNKYVSLFAPGVSYIIAPGFVIGSWLGNSQVGAYSVISFFAFLNCVLIVLILHKYNVGLIASTLAAIVFIFATPAFSYAGTLYQHHISTFLILACIYLLSIGDSFLIFTGVWFLVATSIPVDYPNLILMIPIIIWSITRTIYIKATTLGKTLQLSIPKSLAIVGITVPLIFFLWFNNASYGNPLQFSGTVPSVKDIGPDGRPTAPKEVNKYDLDKFVNPNKQKKSATGFFKTRNLINGLYTQLFSADRGVISFAPVLLILCLGIFSAVKKQTQLAQICISIIVANIILYSLWGDPWGGWAFGARYLVPTYALAAILIGLALQAYRSSMIFLAIFISLFVVSTYINTAGALTSNANPPKVEVLNLEKLSGHEEKYTYKRNIDKLKSGSSKSFAFQTYYNRQLSAWNFFQIITCSIMLFGATLTGLLYTRKKE